MHFRPWWLSSVKSRCKRIAQRRLEMRAVELYLSSHHAIRKVSLQKHRWPKTIKARRFGKMKQTDFEKKLNFIRTNNTNKGTLNFLWYHLETMHGPKLPSRRNSTRPIKKALSPSADFFNQLPHNKLARVFWLARRNPGAWNQTARFPRVPMRYDHMKTSVRIYNKPSSSYRRVFV